MPLLPYAPVDPRRLDNPVTGGINAVTGQSLKTLVQTQATSPNVPPGVNNGLPVFTEDGGVSNLRQNPETGELYDPGGPPGYATAPGEAGVGAQDDAANPSNAAGSSGGVSGTGSQSSDKTVSGELNPNSQNELITPRSNVLDRFSSYTYRASVYMMSPEQYTAMQMSTKKSVNGYQLLFQSGGAPNNTGGFQGALNSSTQTFFENDGTASVNTNIPGNGAADAGRNPAFPQDFYIDSITIENIIGRKATGAAHALANLKFTVIEPQNITLVSRLWQAAQDYAPNNFGGTAINYNAVTYLMVIRFYGYDENGNIVPGISGADPSQGLTDPASVIEKFIPFKITKLNWSVSGKNVQYDIEGVPVPLIVAAGTRRGTIPYDLQLNDINLEGLLGGDIVYGDTAAESNVESTANVTAQTAARTGVNLSNTAAGGGRGGPSSYTPPPSKANAAPTVKNVVRQGLVGAMNEYQANLVKRQIYEVPDTYEIVWAAGSESIKNASILIPGKKQDRQQSGMASPTTSDPSSLNETKVSTDKTIRNFSITAGMQVVQVIDLAIRNSTYITEQALVSWVDDKLVLNPDKVNKPVTWYNVTFRAIQKKPYDKLRNDYAYHIQFIISPWRIDNFNSRYFPLNDFRGVHKSYPYWFTGKNTAVLDFSEKMDALYHITVSGSDPKNSAAERHRREVTSNLEEIVYYSYQSASMESRQGASGKSYETSASLSESLYSPSDQARAKVRIIGDPAWIQQGSIACGIEPSNFNYSVFLPDGTINFDASQVLFEIAWQRPDDYDLTSGLADQKGQLQQPLQSRVYEALQVTSEFRQGKFEQVIDGGLYPFIKPNKPTNKAVGAASATNSNDQVRSNGPAADAVGAATRTTAKTPTQLANGDYPNTSDSPLLPTGTLPAPTKENSMVVGTANSTVPAEAPLLQPQTPPAPPTTGSGEAVESTKNIPPPAVGKLTLEGLSPAPTDPQEMVREA